MVHAEHPFPSTWWLTKVGLGVKPLGDQAQPPRQLAPVHAPSQSAAPIAKVTPSVGMGVGHPTAHMQQEGSPRSNTPVGVVAAHLRWEGLRVHTSLEAIPRRAEPRHREIHM
jgi:hypothetical protein